MRSKRLCGKDLIAFLENLSKEKFNALIYNEFSLQFELAFFLRMKGFEVFFEINVKDERISNRRKSSTKFEKKEMDLFVINKDKSRCAIELKFPIHPAYSKRKKAFEKDQTFMKQMIQIDEFVKTFCLILVRNDGIGEKFRKTVKDVKWEKKDDIFWYGIKEYNK